ncbi:MAG TPA: DUF3341 domain-containing protein [Armatimonadota bacterium]|jgi:hypothetical protein|nr:DUF3341 domain-containing protein [Armatimonadota bacterium]HOM72893.1 DUF3341 domain-containing protein [Armatimonadota bacterium]HOP79577.1 DUF3341 domain-containing protein [Armatimonadota bacterium]HPP76402.1 DUF3341 domain-containing protein [Armatimonadota bacterium]
MADAKHIRAIFDDFPAFKQALGSLQASGFERYEAYGPVNLEEISPLMPRRGSAVRAFATIGAVIGLVLFFYMCIATSLIYALIVGGKPPVSNVPFVVVGYEGTILLGAVGAFFGVLILARLLRHDVPSGYDVRFSGDSFGIDVEVVSDRHDEVVRLLENAGAVEVIETDE